MILKDADQLIACQEENVSKSRGQRHRLKNNKSQCKQVEQLTHKLQKNWSLRLELSEQLNDTHQQKLEAGKNLMLEGWEWIRNWSKGWGISRIPGKQDRRTWPQPSSSSQLSPSPRKRSVRPSREKKLSWGKSWSESLTILQALKLVQRPMSLRRSSKRNKKDAQSGRNLLLQF